MLKAELNVESSSTISPAGDSVFKTMLANQQKWQVNNRDWPFMKKRLDIAMVVGTRFYAVPTVTLTDGNSTTYTVDAIDFERPVTVKVKQGNVWMIDPVQYGINETEFTAFDSEAGTPITNTLVLRWDLVSTSQSASQIEVWPVPNAAQTLRFVGNRPLNPLVADADTADLDDLMLVYFTAAEYLTSIKSADAAAKLAKATARINQLTGSFSRKDERFILGNTHGQGETYYNIPRVTHA